MPDSPAPGAPQTGTKSNIAGIATAAASVLSPVIVIEASKYLDPAWVAQCVTPSSISMAGIAVVGAVAAVFGYAAKLWTHATPNKPLA